ncbi:MAG: mechanosensitive ion channel family protein [Halobacteriota archaeon]
MSPATRQPVSMLAAPILDSVVLQTTTAQAESGPAGLVDFLPSLVRVGWFFLGFFAVIVIGRVVIEPTLLRIIRRRNRHNPTLREGLRLYTRVIMLLLAVVVGSGFAGYVRFLTTSAVVVGAVTLAIGVAAQGVIGSIVSGIALVFDPEFNVGDFIEWSDGSGVVQSITLRVTRVRTQNGELVTIPNTILTSQAITRPFKKGNYRVVETIGLAYETDIEVALDHLEAVALELNTILDAPTPHAYLDEFGNDAVIVQVHYWIEDPDRRDVFSIRSAYAKAVKARLEKADITISPASKRDLQGRIDVDQTG